MIYLAEFFMTGVQHAPFNAAFLKVFRRIFPNKYLHFFASADHIIALKRNSGEVADTQFRTVKVLPNQSGNKLVWILKHLNELFRILALYRSAAKDRPDSIVFTSLSPLGLWIVNLLSWKQPVWIVLHGLSILKKENQIKLVDRIYAKLIVSAFIRKSVHKRKYIILEETAAQYLIKLQYLTESEMLVIRHPYIFTEEEAGTSLTAPIIIGHLGSARLNKNSHLFFSLAESFKAEINEGRLLFKLIGEVLPEMGPYLNKYVQRVERNGMLSQEQYAAAIRSAHFSVFFYTDRSYELTSSAAVLDAVKFAKPIFAIKNRSFVSLFSRSNEKIGELYEDFPSLRLGIEDLLKMDGDVYDEYVSGIQNIKKQYSVEHVVKLLTKELKRVNSL